MSGSVAYSAPLPLPHIWLLPPPLNVQVNLSLSFLNVIGSLGHFRSVCILEISCATTLRHLLAEVENICRAVGGQIKVGGRLPLKAES